VPVPSAVTREEYYLEKLTNDSVAVPTPVTRREKFLYFASGGEIDLPSEEKMTRLERLIAKAGGMDVSTPTAVTRLEKFWANVEAGGWKTITGVLPLTFTAKGGTAVDWVIYGNDDVGENLFDIPVKSVISTNDYYAEASIADASITTDDMVSYFNQHIGDTFSFAYDIITEYSGSIQKNVVLYFTDNTVSAFRGDFTITKAIWRIGLRARFDNPAGRGLNYTFDHIMIVKGSTAPATFIPYGYQIPITVSQQGETDKNYDIYIGDSPLTEGETVSKTSTGVDIELFGGENTVSTTLYNKPEMKIKYK
jgi:hypothetical protein